MPRPFATFFAGLDDVYRHRMPFVGLKAKLLAGFALLLLFVMPLNAMKVLWVGAPGLGPRLLFNLIVVLAMGFTLHQLRRGRVDAAGNGITLLLVVPLHLAALLAPGAYGNLQPLSLAVQVFAVDMLVLVLAFVFASRVVAMSTAGIIAVGHVLGYHLNLSARPLSGSLDAAADTLLRDGLITLGLVFCVGYTIRVMIESVHARGEETLRTTREMNDFLAKPARLAELRRVLQANAPAAVTARAGRGDEEGEPGRGGYIE